MKKVQQKFLQSHFLQRDHQDFLKNVEVLLKRKKVSFLFICFLDYQINYYEI